MIRDAGFVVYHAPATSVIERVSGRYSPNQAAGWERVEIYLRLTYKAWQRETEA